MTKDVSKILKWTVGGIEAFIGIPFLGGLIVILSGGVPLTILLGLHIAGLYFATKEEKEKTGHIIGIIGSCVGTIPIVGMIMHLVTAGFLLKEAYEKR